MIFFLVPKQKRKQKDYTSVTTPWTKRPTEEQRNAGSLVAWIEVYPSLDDLKRAVMAAARIDRVCLDMRAQALAEFGIDPLLDSCGGDNLPENTMNEIINKIFVYWPHPLIGNDDARDPRSADPKTHYDATWGKCPFLDADTKKAIATLNEQLAAVTVSGRDQVRICFNIVELARAIIGEITSESSRRLEKILALKLCHSDQLLQKQLQMLRVYLTAGLPALASVKPRPGGKGPTQWRRFEYCSYYLRDPTPARGQSSDCLQEFVRLLVTMEIDPTVTIPPEFGQYLKGWRDIPRQMRCVALLNDLWHIGPEEMEDRKMSLYSEASVDSIRRGDKAKYDLDYGIQDAAEEGPLLGVKDIWDNAWSWNREEDHPATIMYRHFLLPLWGGPSGHTCGSIRFWGEALVRDGGFPDDGAVVLAAGLFAFWRLYYDKRRSQVHTLVESFEGTCTKYVTGRENWPTLPPGELAKLLPSTDAFELISRCTFKGSGNYLAVDPIRLMKQMRATYYVGSHLQAYADLAKSVDAERAALAAGNFFVPQWEAALSDKEQGTGATRYPNGVPWGRLRFGDTSLNKTQAYEKVAELLKPPAT